MKKAMFAVLTAAIMIFTLTACNSDYTISFTTLDKDTDKSFISLEQAMEKGNEICKKYTSDYTESNNFKDSLNDDGTMKCYSQIEYEIHGISEDDFEALKNEFEKAFPQTYIKGNDD